MARTDDQKHDALLAQANDIALCVDGLRSLQGALPPADEELDELLHLLVGRRRGRQFMALVLAALDAGRTPDAGLLEHNAGLLR